MAISHFPLHYFIRMVTADVAVIGGGLIGSATAIALGDRGASVALLRQHRAGAASAAAAGVLAPSLDEWTATVRSFAIEARDRFPAYLRFVHDRTGRAVALDRTGILHLATSDQAAEEIRRTLQPPASWLSASELRDEEPQLAPAAGAAFWPHDGSVDNVELLVALEEIVDRHERISVINAAATQVTASVSPATVDTETEPAISAATVVLCAGAWSGSIHGAPFAEAVVPVRGQLLAFEGATVNHVVYEPGCYLVPRPGCTVAGSTMEYVGFDPGTTAEAAAGIGAAARSLCPALAAEPFRSWAGLRPVTPDLLPLLGRDPVNRALLYACGHSRNGILLAPLTAEIITALIFEESLTFDLSQFDPARFRGTLSEA